MAVKVLILENNPVARSFLCRVVRESFSDTIVISEAGDLESARRQSGLSSGRGGAAPADPFKLFMIDLELPDGNGMELLTELAHYPATKIVTTLYSDDDHLFPALQAGAFGYLLKDQAAPATVEQFRRMSQGEPPLSPAIARRVMSHFATRSQQRGRPRGMPHVALTDRENEVLLRVAKGFTLPEIAVQLELSRHTISDYVKQIYRKLNVSSRAEAALEAQRLGLFGRGRRAQEQQVL